VGAGLLNNLINTIRYEYQYTNYSGTQTLELGDKIWVKAGDTAHTFTTEEPVPQNLTSGLQVKIADSYEGGGVPGTIYRYIGEDKPAVDLASIDYSDPAQWRQMDGRLFEYMGTQAQVDLNTADYSDFELWKAITEENLITSAAAAAALKAFGLEGGTGESMYGLLAFNEVTSDALAAIDTLTVNANGKIIVQALENAQITAEDRSVVDASKDAKGGVISVNMVNSDAAASIVESRITTDLASTGDVVVDAKNTAVINAVSTTTAKTGQDALGIVVSLNTVGYDASNILFSVTEVTTTRLLELILDVSDAATFNSPLAVTMESP